MASASKTQNLNLPQWVGTEKPERTDFNAAFDAIDTNLNLVQSAISPPNWTVPTFKNSWEKFTSGTIVGYTKDAQGFVRLRGLVKSGTIGTEIFTLPVGYRPPTETWFVVMSNLSWGLLYISSAGDVVAHTGSNGSFSLDGICFVPA